MTSEVCVMYQPMVDKYESTQITFQADYPKHKWCKKNYGIFTANA